MTKKRIPKRYFSDWGECTDVDYSMSEEKKPSLIDYHPEPLCNKEDKFKAKTIKIDDYKIRLKVNNKWGRNIKTVLKRVKFTYDGSKLIGLIKPAEYIGGWYLYRWEIKIISFKNCDGEMVDTFSDQLFWAKHDTNKAIDLTKLIEALKNKTDKGLKIDNKINELIKLSKASIETIETNWKWPPSPN